MTPYSGWIKIDCDKKCVPRVEGSVRSAPKMVQLSHDQISGHMARQSETRKNKIKRYISNQDTAEDVVMEQVYSPVGSVQV